MKFKKVVLLVFLVTSLVSLPVWCADIRIEGFGSSLEEAKDNATIGLSRYVNGMFVHGETTESSLATSNSTEYGLSSKISMTTNGYLKSVEYEEGLRDGATFRMYAVIRDNDVNVSVFVGHLNDCKTTIESLYKKLSSQSDEQKKNTLISIYSTLLEYDAYKTILSCLGHYDLVSVLSVPVSTTSIYTEYQNIIIAEGYALEERKRFITDETEHKKLLEQLSKNRSEQRRLEREKNEATAAKEAASKLALEERLKQYSELSGFDTSSYVTTETERYSSLRENVRSTKENFLSACSEYDKLCKEQFSLIDKDFEAEKTAVEARPYRFAELLDGRPTAAASEIREQEVEYLYKLKEMHKVSVFKQIRDALLDSIRGKYDSYCEALNSIDGEVFEIVLDGSSMTNVSIVFDSVGTIWSIDFDIVGIDGLEDHFCFELRYGQLTGKPVTSPKYRGQSGYEEYLEFLDEVDYFQSVISDFAEYFKTSIRFKVAIKEDDSYIDSRSMEIENIQFVVESNSIPNNPDWVAVVNSNPSVLVDFSDLTWELPGYSRTFNQEFSK